MSEQARALVLRHHDEIWSRGNLAAVDEVYAPSSSVISRRSAQGARTSSAQAPERSGETWEKCPKKARSRSGHALVASWSCTGSCDDHAHAVALRVSSPGASATSAPDRCRRSRSSDTRGAAG